jgi:energy-coupling factor transporter ATP-binding protein EcfA2
LQPSTTTFLNRTAELERLRGLLRQGKSVLLTGPSGMGKTALLEELRRVGAPGGRELVFTAGNLEPADWLRAVSLALLCAHDVPALKQRLSLSGRPEPEAARQQLRGKSAGALRAVLFETLAGAELAFMLDPLGFISRPFYELLRDLHRATAVPFILAARSPHMEEIGYATKFALPREQCLALGPLAPPLSQQLFDAAISVWPRQPQNLEAFRAHVLDYAGGNPGTILGMLQLARQETYWAGDSVKAHLLTVDFNLPDKAASRR